MRVMEMITKTTGKSRVSTLIGGLAAGVITAVSLGASPGTAWAEQNERKALRVCADPYSLPQSSKEQNGYENKIAELFAADLGIPVEYTWFPQRMGFIRNTLRSEDTPDGSYKCDIVMGVVEGFELAATTDPYYHSGWSMVYVKGTGLDDIKTPEDLAKLPEERKSKLRIGSFDRAPTTKWLFQNDMINQMVGFQIMSGDARESPGDIIENKLIKGDLDIVMIWGPIAGYYAKKHGEAHDVELEVIPMRSEPGIKLDYKIAMAVRYGEREWRDQVNGLLAKHKDAIRQILLDYGVPLIEEE